MLYSHLNIAYYICNVDKRETKMDKSEKVEGLKDKEQQEEVLIPFKCDCCGLSEHCHYFGKNPNFARKQVVFFEATYLMRDPFTPRVQGKANFLIIGGQCYSCGGQVCASCSIYYEHRFCRECAKSNKSDFPVEIQSKIVKM